MTLEKHTSIPCCQGQKTLQKTAPEVTSKKPMPTGPKTRIIIHYDVGFPNSLYIRGEGSELSWEKGLLLKNVKSDEWIWETTKPFTTCQFKILINDSEYELGENHLLTYGASVHYTPKFH